MMTKNTLKPCTAGFVIPLCVLIIISSMMPIQMAEAKCHPTMVVRNEKMSNPPPLNTSSLAPDVRAAADLKNNAATFWYTVPRKDVVKYCKDYSNAKSKMQQMLEVRPTTTPKTTSMIYMTASSKACKSPGSIQSSSLIQQTALVVDRSSKVIVNCPPNDSVCYVYKLTPKSTQSPAQHGRKLQCSGGAVTCNQNSDCCSGTCTPGGSPGVVGSCTCIAIGNSCSTDNACCSYYCTSGVCRDEATYNDPNACFPGDATVELADGRSTAIAELRLGDRIKVVDHQSGRIKSEPALFWLHRNPSSHSPYVRIQAANTELRISPNHFLHVSKGDAPVVFSTSFMAPAMDVQPGWYVWVKSLDDDLSPALVTSVTSELHQGAYSIMTDSGTVLVNSVAASNHADIVMRDGSLMCELFVSKKNIPAYQHAFLAPLRFAAKVLGPNAMEKLSSVNAEGSLSVWLGKSVRNSIDWVKKTDRGFVLVV